MDQLINSLPKTVVAIGAILIGFFLIVMNDPPKTVCDTQMELFRESQRTFLYAPPESKLAKSILVKDLHKLCKDSNSPGGCFEYFQRLKKFVVDLENMPKTCADTVAAESAVKVWLWESLKIIAQISWGDRIPASYSRKHGWLDASDLALFCDLKKNAGRLYGDHVFAQWREEVLNSFPGADQVDREVLWRKSIFSTPCTAFQ